MYNSFINKDNTSRILSAAFLPEGVIFRLFVSILMLSATSISFAQQTSKNNYTGNWESASSWSPSWTSPVRTSLSMNVTINGFITAAGSVSFDGSGGNLIINDTLVINGDLTMGNNNNLTVNNNGVLIIRGNLTVSNQTDIAANAYIIVTGNFTKDGSAGQGSFTSNDTPSNVFIGGTKYYPVGWASTGSGVFNCSLPQEHSNTGCNHGNFTDLVNNPIFDFFESTCTTPPIITVQPQNAINCGGNTFSFTVNATGATSYQWLVNTGSGFTNVTNGGVYSGATTATLNITGVNSSYNGYRYSCLVNNGSCAIQSNTAFIVNAIPGQPSEITGDNQVCSGTSQVYSVVNTPGISYYWSYSGSGAAITGNGSNSVTINFSTGATSGELMVTPSNSCGTGMARSMSIQVASPEVNGSRNVFTGRNQVYSTAPGMAAYSWVVTGGAITSGQNTNAIVVAWDNTPGTGTVAVSYSQNSCTVHSGSIAISKSAFPLSCFQYRRPVNIAGGMVSGGPHVDFPVVLNVTNNDLRSVPNGGKIAHNAGYDIYFAQNADGSSPLEYQTEYYNPVTGQLVVWIKIPSLAGAGTFYMFYGNYSITFDASSENVWGRDYLGIFHMGGSLDDFGIHQNNGTNIGTAVVPGKIGMGRDFVRSEKDFIQIANEPAFNFTGQQTVSFWMKLDSYSGSAWTDYMAKGDNANWRFVGDPTNQRMFYSFGTGGTDKGYTSDLFSGNSSVTPGNWYHITGTFNGDLATNTKSLYINGVLVSSQTTGLPDNMQSYTVNNKPLLIGINSQADDLRAFDGIMDEIRISNQARSAGWIATEFNNQNTPGNITLGAEVSLYTPSATAGTASASPTTLYAREFTVLSLAGYTGTIQWQSSTDNLTFTNLTGKTSASQATDPLLSNTWFRAIVTNGGCPAASNAVLVSVTPPYISCVNGKRKKITIPDEKYTGSDDLMNFPFLLQITNDNNLRTIANGGDVNSAQGYDIRFTSSDGVSMLAQQVESYDPVNGSITVWVQIPRIYAAGNTDFYMYYGDPANAASNPSTPAVWSSDYTAVFHMGTSGTNDATARGNHGTNNGTTNLAAGKIGAASVFNGSSNYITIANESQFDVVNDGKLTISGWMYVNNYPSTYTKFVDKGTGSWTLQRDNNTNTVEMRQDYDGGQFASAKNTNGIPAGSWRYLVATYDHETNNTIVYINGSAAASSKNDPTNENLQNNNNQVRIGANAGVAGNFFNGNMDEVRIQNVARSADWIKFEYENQNNPSGFATISAATSCNLGAPTPGTASANKTNLCIGQSATLTLTGYSGGIYWQSSVDNINWNYIPGANSATMSTGAINQSTYFRASVSNCCEAFSNAVLITFISSPAPVVAPTSNSPVCVNGTITLTGSPTGMSTYNWTGPASFTSSVIDPVQITGVTTSHAGTYTLSVVAPNGCSASGSAEVIVNSLPVIGMNVIESSGLAANDGVICYGSSANLAATGGNIYAWLPVTGLSAANIANPDANPAATTTYTVTVTDENGCKNTRSQTITVNPVPTAVINISESSGSVADDGIICRGDQVSLTASGGTGYSWNGGPATSNYIATPLANTTYQVLVTNIFGCTDTETRDITVVNRPVTGQLFRMPNN